MSDPGEPSRLGGLSPGLSLVGFHRKYLHGGRAELRPAITCESANNHMGNKQGHSPSGRSTRPFDNEWAILARTPLGEVFSQGCDPGLSCASSPGLTPQVVRNHLPEGRVL